MKRRPRASLEAEEDAAEEVVRYALRRRGFNCGPGRHHGTVVPNDPGAADTLYPLLKHYSFRLFLRDLIRYRSGATLPQLTRYCSAGAAGRFLDSLRRISVVRRRRDGTVCLVDQSVHSFGPTLEWFVARALRSEFGVPSAWNLRPHGARGGGDYDVVGSVDGALVYVEVKSSAPRNIEQRQIAAFAERLVTLSPDMAVLLNDTKLRMLDKLIPALRAELGRHPFARGPLRRVRGEIFARAERLFVTNSAPDLIANLGTCLERFFRARSGR